VNTRKRRLFCAVALIAVGCGKSHEDPSAFDTGAKEAVRVFYSAIVNRDWPVAYAVVHPDGRRGWSQGQFAGRADTYRKQLGFEPITVRVPTCEEHGQEATAHLEISGKGGGRTIYKDAITLRNFDGRWLIVLPANFGQVR
jgi:hypothetical protein